MSNTRSHEEIAMLRRPASPGMCVPFAGISFDNPYQAHLLYHPATPPRPGRVRGTPICVNLRHYFLPRVSAPVFSVCNRADTPGQPIFRSLFIKRDWFLRRAIRCGGGSGSRMDFHQTLQRMDGVPIKSGQFSLIRRRSIRFISKTSLPC